MRAPWEKHPDETPKNFEAFKTYRDLPPLRRSIAAAVEAMEKGRKKGGNPRTRARKAEELSRKFAWPARAAAWDEERDRRHRETILKETEGAARRHFDDARSLTEEALKALKAIPETKDPQAAYFRAGAFARIMTALPKIQQAEREALGLGHKRKRESLPLPPPSFLDLPEAERPCSPQVERRLYQVLADGLPLHDAARIAGLDPDAVDLWQSRAAEGPGPYMAFAQNIERTEALARHRLIQEVRSAPTGTSKAASWLLERRYPDEFRLVDEDKLAEILEERDGAFEDRLTRAVLRYVPDDKREAAAEEIQRAFGEQEDPEDSQEE